MKKELVKIDIKHELSSIPETDAKMILASFKPVNEALSALDSKTLAVLAENEITKELCEKARKLRLQYRDARTLGDKIHKEIKADVLLRSKAIDGARNMFKLEISQREDALEEIEKHFENIEKERMAKVAAQRKEALLEFGLDNVEHFRLEEMEDEVWTAFYSAQKRKYEDEQAAIEKAAAEKEDRERKERLGKKRMDEILNSGLYLFMRFDAKEFSEMTEKEFEKLKEKLKELKNQKEKEDEEIRKENERLKKDQEKRDLELQKQREKQAKIEAELKAKKAKEAQEKAEAEEKAKAEEKARKNSKYKEFLSANGVDRAKIARGEYLVKQEGSTFILYRAIDSIVIE